MRLLPRFRETICKAWGLKLPAGGACEGTPSAPAHPRKKLKAAPRSLQTLPETHGQRHPDVVWENSACSMVFVVDCQPLAEIMNGKSPLQTPELTPAFERMTRRLFQVLDAGWHVNAQCNDPVVWHRREYNRIADYLVNYTIDLGADWHHAFPSPDGD